MLWEDKYPNLKKVSNHKLKPTWYCCACNTGFCLEESKVNKHTSYPCKCTLPFRYWDLKNREFQIKEICSERGLSFLGWKDTYKGNKSRVFIKCKHHPHFEVSINNFTNVKTPTGCLPCSRQKTKHALTADKHKIITEGLKAHGSIFDYTDFVYINSRTPSKVKCTVCDTAFLVSYDNHVNKRRGCPACRGKNQNTLYLLDVLDSEDNLFCIKYGITRNINSRLADHSRKNKNIVFKLNSVFNFDSYIDCRSTENKIKSALGSNHFSKKDILSGFTECVPVDREQEILNIINDSSGVKIREEYE